MSLENVKKVIEASLNECLTIEEIRARLSALSVHVQEIGSQITEQEQKQAQMHAQMREQAQPEQFEEAPQPEQ